MKKRFLLIFFGLLLFGCSNSSNLINKEADQLSIYTSAKDTEFKMTLTDTKSFSPSIQPLETENAIFVNPNETFQTMLGIGGAITDASAEVFYKLSDEKQSELLNAYYNPETGIGYTLGRTNIHSCDFSSGSYTYVDNGDSSLNSFSIDHDRQYRIPLIKRALNTAGFEFPIYASPWSPPAFMKDNNHMLKGGKLLPQYYKPWALYFTKFIKEYEKEGIPIWGITIQNEPMAVQTWESCIYTAEEERDFLKNYLGPVMAEEGLGNKNIIIWDHNRDLLNHRANTILDDPDAAQYVWGVGFHWYETWAGGDAMYVNVANVYESYPSKNLLFTEGCVGDFKFEKLQEWSHAEKYGSSMINDFNSGTVGWTDWNILLDENGGPNHVKNFCFAPVHADTRTGELIYTPSYYYIGHFSKFIRPDAKRISTVSSKSFLLAASFVNTDGKIATIVMNDGDTILDYKLFFGSQSVELNILPHSIQTIVY